MDRISVRNADGSGCDHHGFPDADRWINLKQGCAPAIHGIHGHAYFRHILFLGIFYPNQQHSRTKLFLDAGDAGPWPAITVHTDHEPVPAGTLKGAEIGQGVAFGHDATKSADLSVSH